VVEVVLARTATELPGDGWAFEPKWDGWRGVLSRGRLTSRHGKDLSRRFPGLLGQLPIGTRLDGEIVCWSHGRLDFAGLQRGQRDGICFVAFDVLHAAGNDVRKLPIPNAGSCSLT
jgi:ATP-dependent DNA ligase